MKKVTLSTIASKLNVSITTISRILNGKAEKYRISPSTTKKVLEECRRCGYIPLHSAQNLRKGTSGMIGVLIPAISNPFFADMASVIVTRLYELSYIPIVIDTMENETIFSEAIHTLISRQVEGIIAVPCGNDPVVVDRYRDKVPIVLVDRYYPDTALPYVTTNNYQGGVIGTEKLLAQGYSSIVCIQGAISSMPNRERVRGYHDAMASAGLEERCTVIGNDFTIQNGYLETKLLLSNAPWPQAIFALSNTILLGVLKALRETDLKIPEDIAVLSFDDNVYMDYLTPSIARMSQPTADMAALAVKILMDSLSGLKEITSQIKLLPTFIPGLSI